MSWAHIHNYGMCLGLLTSETWLQCLLLVARVGYEQSSVSVMSYQAAKYAISVQQRVFTHTDTHTDSHSDAGGERNNTSLSQRFAKFCV